MTTPFRLRSLPLGARLGLTLLLLANLGGFVASAGHLVEHHENRDELPEMSIDDLKGAYHGIRTRAPLVVALEDGHPGELEGSDALPAEQRDALLAWLASEDLAGSYDDLDLGDNAPAEVLDINCVDCHRRGAEGPYPSELSLEYWDDVRAVAQSRDVSPTSTKILLASTHTHAIALATIGLIIALLLCFTAMPGLLQSLLITATGAGLVLDLAAWWLARDNAGWVIAIVIGGTAYSVGIVLMTLAVFAELWRPGGEA